MFSNGPWFEPSRLDQLDYIVWHSPQKQDWNGSWWARIETVLWICIFSYWKCPANNLHHLC